ncbi:ethanolamine utilization protein EutJ [Sinanaerobacter sp. ZZT-01]|uniref:ethanolamine utilization protein EutJ n=1 Tax=Sinanaerobacter sp. ZZT-01 TaxID=3111540 RepID=UPI002D767248|nr:ethanolamine utilization protein EutJ [Sinanaerobacter sp. ZZT-01]WRR92078.1 ethanolamine utilization protein EutJ [Sinanaerobacter sp. ZZT-01]
MNLQRVNKYMERIAQSETTTFEPTGEKLKVGVDLGTAYIVMVVLDEQDNPIACEKQAANVLKDGVVVDYLGALQIVKDLKGKLEKRLGGRELLNCAIAMPAGTESSVNTHTYVAEGAGFEVTNVLDEPSAANAVYQIENGAVVDIGGGTTGIAILHNGKVIRMEDEATGGTHISLVLAGNFHIDLAQAEEIKQDYSKHKEILPVVKAVVEKMAAIVKRYVHPEEIDTIYLCGGTCCLTGIEKIFEKETGIITIKPDNPFLVTPAGIAMNCIAG